MGEHAARRETRDLSSRRRRARTQECTALGRGIREEREGGTVVVVHVVIIIGPYATGSAGDDRENGGCSFSERCCCGCEEFASCIQKGFEEFGVGRVRGE